MNTRAFGRIRVGERGAAGTVARPVFVVLRPPGGPDAAPDAESGRSPVADSSFNGGWRWWLQLGCGLLAIVEGASLILMALGLGGLL